MACMRGVKHAPVHSSAASFHSKKFDCTDWQPATGKRVRADKAHDADRTIYMGIAGADYKRGVGGLSRRYVEQHS